MTTRTFHSGDTDITYIDTTVITNNNNTVIPCKFEFKPTQTILEDTHDFQLSVMRFSMDGVGRSLPLWIPQIDKTQSNVNTTIWSITFTGVNNGISLSNTQVLQWVCPDTTLVVPSSGTPQSMTNPYYYAYNYQTFCDMWNTAATNAWIALQVQLTAAGGGYTINTLAPILQFDSTSLKFSLLCDSAGFGAVPTHNYETYSINFNENLWGQLQGFICKKTASNTYLVNTVMSVGLSSAIVSTGLINYLTFSQEYPCVDSLWSPIACFVFATSWLPIVPEMTQPPIINGSSILISGNTFTVLTDIAVNVTTASDNKGYILYVPESEYRMISMDGAVKNVDVSVFWRSILTGELIPVNMWRTSSANMKLMIRRIGC